MTLEDSLATLIEQAVERALARHRSVESSKPGASKLMLSIPEAAKALSLSERTVYRLIDAGELHANTIGSIQRLAVAELERWVQEGVSSEQAQSERPGLHLAK